MPQVAYSEKLSFFSGANLYNKVAGFQLYQKTPTQGFSCFLQNTHGLLLKEHKISLKTAPINIAINFSNASYQKWIQSFLFFENLTADSWIFSETFIKSFPCTRVFSAF